MRRTLLFATELKFQNVCDGFMALINLYHIFWKMWCRKYSRKSGMMQFDAAFGLSLPPGLPVIMPFHQ